jgi:manganese/zinc/iron transport system permease protein
MIWMEMDTWIVVVGVLCAAACALPGSFLVLRRMSMMGDAISHAVLPGLGLAYILTESRADMSMFLGAAVVGVLTAVFTQWVSRFGNVDRGAAMGIVFTTLFALGLVMIEQVHDKIDLDASCVLMGAIEHTPDLTMTVLGQDIPQAVVILGGVFLLNLLIILVLYKEFRLTAFDPDLADALGISSTRMHYLLMIMVAVTTVASFEAVGSIIVIAMLVVPAATAWLLTDRLGVLLGLAVVFGALSAVLGHLGAITIPVAMGFDSVNTSGSMATVSGVLFVLVWMFSPRQGLIVRRFRKHAVLDVD